MFLSHTDVQRFRVDGGENDSNTLRVSAYFFEKGEINLSQISKNFPMRVDWA